MINLENPNFVNHGLRVCRWNPVYCSRNTNTPLLLLFIFCFYAYFRSSQVKVRKEVQLGPRRVICAPTEQHRRVPECISKTLGLIYRVNRSNFPIFQLKNLFEIMIKYSFLGTMYHYYVMEILFIQYYSCLLLLSAPPGGS